MKLGELRAALRSFKGNPSVALNIAGANRVLPLQKTPLIAALGEIFANDPEGRNVYTGLTFDNESGILSGFGDRKLSLDVDVEADELDLDEDFDLDDEELDI